MKFLFIDAYKKSIARVSKDTAGGYGTHNSLGDSFIGMAMSWVINKSVFWPNLSFIQLIEELENKDHICDYVKQAGSKIGDIKNYDIIFVCSSIVCFETEIELCLNLQKITHSPIYLCGTVAQHLLYKVPNNIRIMSGNYEFFCQYLDQKSETIKQFIKDFKNVKVPNGIPENLTLINWDNKNIPKTKNKILGGNRIFFPYIFNRGCPYSCYEYCTYPTTQGRKVLQESIKHAVKNFIKIALKYPKAHIVFRDPVFSINIKQTKALLKAIGDEKLDLNFSVELHLRNIDDEFIELCKYAKIKWLKFGIESAYEDIRNSVDRFSVNNDKQREIINKLKQAGLKTVGMFILVQPDDTIQTCRGTIKYACSLGLSVAQFSIFTAYPGTPYYNTNLSKLDFENFEEISQFHLTYKHNSITKSQARYLLETAYIKFIMSKLFNCFSLNLFQK